MPRIIDVVQFLDDTGNEIVHREPQGGPGDFRLGSQVIVRESQRAVFFRDGKAMDTFAPGRHTITTYNIPILASIIGLATSGQSPFPAEVIFVNMRDFVDQKWGSPEPIVFRDTDLGMVRLRSFGAYAYGVKDPTAFVNVIAGQQGIFSTQALADYLRNIIVSKLTDVLGEQKSSVLDLPSQYNELGAAARTQLNDEFSGMGLALKAFYISAITPTEETAKAIDERASMGAIGDMDKYLKFKAARAIGDAAQQPGGASGAMDTGIGLGAGMGMGAGLAGMMAQAMQTQNKPASAAPQTQVGSITCPTCGTVNPAGSKFCNNDGTKFTIKCPTCGTENPAGAKFCSNDGTKLS